MRKGVLFPATVVGFLQALPYCAIGDEIQRGDLGGTEKLRILVDKVMQPEEGWVTKEWIVRETAEAGFNVFSPRRGHDRLNEVRQVTAWCEKYGIFHIPWMRGTLEAPEGAGADGKRVLWAHGGEQLLWSACSDEFWEWTTRYIVEYAKMSAETDRIIGVFLDYENYWPGGQGNLYQLTYEDIVLKPFLEAKGKALPELEPGERKSWLEEQGLHQAFGEFQVNRWRERCRKLRQEVDRYDPRFQFCVYPAPGTPFIVQATYPEWSTRRAPLILADARVYGRSSRFLPQREALDANHRKLLSGMKVPQEAGIPFIYSGGIDPIVRGADPEFCGKNAVMISEITGGYWVFYEGSKYNEDHPDYFRWFRWANQRIKTGQLQGWREPRETPERWVLEVFQKLQGDIEVAAPEVTASTTDFHAVTLRRENLFLVAAKRRQPVRIVLRNAPVSAYVSTLAWELRDGRSKRIASGTIPHQSEGTVRFTPDRDGIYLLGASSGSCAYSLVSANAPIGLFTGHGASFIHAAGQMYFHVPRGAENFRVEAAGWRDETVRVNVLDPKGTRVATGQTTPRGSTVEIKVETRDGAGKTWSLETARADEGVVEDYSLRLSSELPPVLSFVPEHVFTAKLGK